MSLPLIVEEVVARLERSYGRGVAFGRSRLWKFGSAFACSLNYSKLLGHKYFFGLAKEVVDPSYAFPDTDFGEFVVLVCGSPDQALVLPRAVVLEMIKGVSSRRVDVFCADGSYVLQTTRHPKLNVTEFLNAFPKAQPPSQEGPDGQLKPGLAEHAHARMQWALIHLGRAEGCSVWVPPADRNLSYKRQPFRAHLLEKLPNFGFDENARRIVQNIDVLWLTRNVIRKAFEIESTTMIYSGLLRLNDLVLSQPNNNIDLYIVAEQAKRIRVHRQLLRPSFQSLISKCEFLSFEHIDDQLARVEKLALRDGARVSGLVRGERFEVHDQFIFPTTM